MLPEKKMSLNRLRAMIEIHRRAENAFRASNQPEQAERARQLRLKLEAELKGRQQHEHD